MPFNRHFIVEDINMFFLSSCFCSYCLLSTALKSYYFWSIYSIISRSWGRPRLYLPNDREVMIASDGSGIQRYTLLARFTSDELLTRGSWASCRRSLMWSCGFIFDNLYWLPRRYYHIVGIQVVAGYVQRSFCELLRASPLDILPNATFGDTIASSDPFPWQFIMSGTLHGAIWSPFRISIFAFCCARVTSLLLPCLYKV